ncbi:hypothetical protein [Sessilibacter corallicola]|uniref:hypothetical protein n=1 Tax=Sessilibacter corallicola TaxID=2904075 RepID=UPI001E5A2B1D|nr:hypothetical protein [Sessilibacter corallicola]MCE2027495.1 hypothetical protein [Sessilibacter corallicola]
MTKRAHEDGDGRVICYSLMVSDVLRKVYEPMLQGAFAFYTNFLPIGLLLIHLIMPSFAFAIKIKVLLNCIYWDVAPTNIQLFLSLRCL